MTLTLASAVTSTDTVKVRYTRPSTKPLHRLHGKAVDTFADQDVTVLVDRDLWSATLTSGTSRTFFTGCSDASSSASEKCNERLTENSFTWRGTTYQVARIESIVIVGGTRLFIGLDQVFDSSWTLHIGSRQLSVADAALSDGGKTASWFSSSAYYGSGQVQLRLTRPTPALSAPEFQSAAVDGTTLTLTFSANLDTASRPAHGDFHVTVGTARRNVASGGVAISGQTVTLTLESAVTDTDTVKVRYTKPTTNPLQGVSGTAVDTFADQSVTNNTPVTPPSPKFAVVTVDRK